jgi:DNA primase catalytic subunit
MDSEDARKQSLGELHERRKQDPALSESRKVMTRELTWPPRRILAEYLAKRLPWSQRHRSARREAPAVPRRREYAERKANMRAERRLSKNFAFPAYNSFPTYN